MSKEIAKQISKHWLAGAANSAAPKDLEIHMGMISKGVSPQNIPSFDNIDYDAWSVQCQL